MRKSFSSTVAGLPVEDPLAPASEESNSFERHSRNKDAFVFVVIFQRISKRATNQFRESLKKAFPEI